MPAQSITVDGGVKCSQLEIQHFARGLIKYKLSMKIIKLINHIKYYTFNSHENIESQFA